MSNPINLQKCANGHFYDADKYPVCPHCQSGGMVGMTPPYSQAAGDANSYGQAYAGTPNMYQQAGYVNPQSYGGFYQDDSKTMDKTVRHNGLGFAEGTAPFTGGTNESTTEAANDLKNLVQDSKEAGGAASFSEENVTVAYRSSVSVNQAPVVGWLVCVAGISKGRSFELKGGKNFIGRSDSNDIVLKGDDQVSREKHAILIFEPDKKVFYVQEGDSRGMLYVNDELTTSRVELKDRDILRMGDYRLMFVQLCGQGFNWD